MAKLFSSPRAYSRRWSGSVGIVPGKNRSCLAGRTQCSFSSGPRTVTAATRSVSDRTCRSFVSGSSSNVSSWSPAAQSTSNSYRYGLPPCREYDWSESTWPSAWNTSRHLL